VNLELGLETPAPTEKPYSVSQLVLALQQRVAQLPVLWIEGEISDFSAARSGHWYFKLKDRQSCIQCMVWADDVRKYRLEKPADGLKVYVHGRLDVYTAKGELRFVVRQLLPTPEGGFHALQLERVRAALEKDGLFDPARKRALPALPACIGVVTSADGAAWHDIVAVVRRRWPACELILVPTRVQGSDAPRNIVRAIELANRFARLDILIVGRGGGSAEDLNAFNDEAVARAVAAARVPTISAVGHEVDTTLTDLVADVRAPTPSAAAEKAVPDRGELLRLIGGLGAHIDRAISGRVRGTRRQLEEALYRMQSRCDSKLARLQATADRYGASLEALSPLKVLERGYAVARGDDGRVLKRTADLPTGKAFRLRVQDGEVRGRVE
jgi:exodeoxyribonuclease VII large subunit